MGSRRYANPFDPYARNNASRVISKLEHSPQIRYQLPTNIHRHKGASQSAHPQHYHRHCTRLG